MMRSVRAITVVVLVTAGAARSTAQPSSAAPSAQAAIEEARQLHLQATKLYDEARYQEALAPAERALVIREQVLGPDHADVAQSLNLLAEIYRDQGAYPKAEPLYRRALGIREKALGPTHRDVAESLNNLANLYATQGAYPKAEPLYLRALDIREQALGPDHPDVANVLNNLAVMYRDQGEYTRAEPLQVRALAIDEKALGPDHPDIATDLNNLAVIYGSQGTYAKAEPLMVRALALDEKTRGPEHPDVAIDLNNLAMLYRDQGAYTKAVPLLVRALGIREKALGPDHAYVAIDLNNLAMLYQAQGAYAKAEPLFLRARDIREKALGPAHPDVAGSWNNLAELYRAQGAYAKAEPLFLRALEVWEKALGPAHPDVATGLGNLATLYVHQGAYAKAEPLFLRALDVREKALGPSHPLIANSLHQLAWLYWARGAYGQVEPYMARAADIDEQRLRGELVRLPEPRKRALMTVLQQATDSIISFHADAAPRSSSALALALTTVLRRKGRILDSLIDSESRLRGQLTPQLRGQLDQLARARSELATQLYASGPHGAGARARARDRIDQLETALSAASAEFRVQTQPVTVASVKATLPAGTALVELVRYQRFDAARSQPAREERYVAYLLLPLGPPRWVALGNATPIDAEVDAVLATLRDRASRATTQAALRRLDALVLAPIRTQLSGISHLILAPDGKLNLVPFEALIDPQGHHAIERYLVSYVTAGRDLLRLAVPEAPRSPAVIVAAPAYGPVAPGPAAVSFVPLPDALAEATDLRPYFAAAPLTGARATKSALAALTGPAMLHVATHGFYARDAATGPPAPAVLREVARGMYMDLGSSSARPPAPRADDLADALDRSGLAMAGANLGAAGIVTAREIAGFDWRGTQLVVLAACETGAGAASSGDGVYGMRRALVLAGAASQVVSLWSVEDSATRALFRDYYGNLARGAGRAEALRQAKLRWMRQPGHEHPGSWAAFIPAGDWRPLDKRAMPASARP